MKTPCGKLNFLRRSLLLSALAFGLAACETPTTVSISDPRNPPTFKLSGSGGLIFFSVSGPYPRPEGAGSELDARTVWKITGEAGADATARRLPPITYGNVPPGHRQVVPAAGTPPPLEEGKYYVTAAPSNGANFRRLCFKVEGGSAVEAPCPIGW